MQEMDGFEPNNGVIVIAATNLEKGLDPALVRAGRFDRHVAVPLPDFRGRMEVLQHYLQVCATAYGLELRLLLQASHPVVACQQPIACPETGMFCVDLLCMQIQAP